MAAQLRPDCALVITNCSARKRSSQRPVSLPSLQRGESLADLARRWSRLLAGAPRDARALDLYAGRAMSESTRVARSLGADLYIVSAGLGLIRQDDLVPNYDITVAGEGPLQRALESTQESASGWWKLIAGTSSSGQTLSRLVRSKPHHLALFALPSSYLRLISADLEDLEDQDLSRVRIFTSPAGRAELAPRLQANCLPYDERLESVPGFAGTRSEFPQRALRHFALALGDLASDLDAAKAKVEASLAGLSLRAVPERQRLSDEQISRMLARNWSAYQGSSTRLLRYLRDEALVACEQGRFRQLWQQVRAERGKASSGH